MTSSPSCPRCSAPFEPGDQFCPACGGAVRFVSEPPRRGLGEASSGSYGNPCQSCGEVVSLADRFCGGCGAPQATPARGSTPQGLTWDEVRQRLAEATLGEFEILDELGRGGMAVVYLAHELSLNRKVAIKVMSPALMMDPGMVARFRREAVTAASLSHANIVTIHGVKNVEGFHFFVMQYVRGRAADLILRTERTLPVPTVRAVLLDVMAGLGYAHRNGVIHRDVKPANVLVDEEGKAIVTDFGIAKMAETEGATLTQGTIGTPAYMSPEQCHGHELSSASDQYSLGIVAYELLAGVPPFRGTNLSIQIGHTQQAPRPIRELRPEVPAEFAAAVMRMLAKDPGARWSTLAEAALAVAGRDASVEPGVRLHLATLASAGLSATRGPRTPISGRPHVVPDTDPEANRVKAVEVDPIGPLVVGDSRQASVRVVGGRSDLLGGRVVTWSSRSPKVAAVSAGGLVRALGRGEAVVEAQCEGMVGTVTITVVAPTVAKIVVDGPGRPLDEGESVAIAARAFDARGREVPDVVYDWRSTTPGVVTVEAGKVTARGEGTGSIQARSGSVTGKLEVRVAPPAVDAIGISPLPDSLAPGDGFTLRADVADRNGRLLAGRLVEWGSDRPGIVAVSPDGHLTARQPGTATITAICEGRRVSLPVEVHAASGTVLTVSGTPPVVAAPVRRSGRPARRARWALAIAAVAALVPLVKVIVADPETMLVVDPPPPEPRPEPSPEPPPLPSAESVSVQVTNRSIRVAVGDSTRVRFRIVASGAAGASPTSAIPIWSLSRARIARIDQRSGMVTALQTGITWVKIQVGTSVDSLQLTVIESAPIRLAITPLQDSLAIGQVVRLTVRATRPNGESTTPPPTSWRSSDPGLVTVAPRTGEVRAVAPGLAVVTVEAGSARAEVEVLVRRPPTQPDPRPRTVAVESTTTPIVGPTPPPPTPDPPVVGPADVAGHLGYCVAPLRSADADRVSQFRGPAKAIESLTKLVRTKDFKTAIGEAVPDGPPSTTGTSVIQRIRVQVRWINPFGSERREWITIQTAFDRDAGELKPTGCEIVGNPRLG